MVDTYNAQMLRWKRKGSKEARAEDLVTFDERQIKWSRDLLERRLKRGHEASFEPDCVREAMYRPFVMKWLYLNPMFVDSPGQARHYLPHKTSENLLLAFSGVGHSKDFHALVADRVLSLDCLEKTHVPLYVYREDGTREDNVTDWALARFQAHYPAEHAARPLAKRDVFHYAYAVLHAPDYRARHAADLRRSLPRLPFAPAFWPFADAGAALAALHVGFETAPEHPLAVEHTPGTVLDAPVTALAWADRGKTALRLSAALTLTGIPPEAHAYRLGTRSALDWLVDQMKDKHDARSGITHRLSTAQTATDVAAHVRRVAHVSVETVRLIAALPPVLPTPPAPPDVPA